LTNLHMLKQWGLIQNACDRSKQSTTRLQIRAYFATLYLFDKQISTRLRVDLVRF
jgi:hypothetical protein